MATVAVRASTQHLERSRMTWKEIGLDLLIVIACYGVFLMLNFIWNFIFAPARLERERKQELKRKAGQESLNQVLAEERKKISEAVDDVLDADEETNK
jgi:type II secretory pathway component PulM